MQRSVHDGEVLHKRKYLDVPVKGTETFLVKNQLYLLIFFEIFIYLYITEVYLPDNKTITKRDTQSQPSKAPIVGQSNPTAHNRLIHQRARQRLHQQQQRARHHITPPTQHRRLHHGHARQHHITPHHHPHLVGSIRERFGGGDEQGGVLKRLSERRKQGKDGERTEGGSKIEKAETRSANEKQSQQKEAVQIITQAPNLIDERK